MRYKSGANQWNYFDPGRLVGPEGLIYEATCHGVDPSCLEPLKLDDLRF